MLYIWRTLPAIVLFLSASSALGLVILHNSKATEREGWPNGIPILTEQTVRVMSVVRNYTAATGDGNQATVFLSEQPDADYYWAYWAEMRMLFSIPKEFHDEAISAPSIIVRNRLVYPDDVREEGDQDLQSSTYLVSFDWYRKKLTDVVTSGRILQLQPPRVISRQRRDD